MVADQELLAIEEDLLRGDTILKRSKLSTVQTESGVVLLVGRDCDVEVVAVNDDAGGRQDEKPEDVPALKGHGFAQYFPHPGHGRSNFGIISSQSTWFIASPLVNKRNQRALPF